MAPLPQMAREGVFSLVLAGCALFVVLTVAAMLAYPGGTATDPTTSGYSFFANVLSELGMTRTYAGQPALRRPPSVSRGVAKGVCPCASAAFQGQSSGQGTGLSPTLVVGEDAVVLDA
jgi:hypothetical protein